MQNEVLPPQIGADTSENGPNFANFMGDVHNLAYVQLVYAGRGPEPSRALGYQQSRLYNPAFDRSSQDIAVRHGCTSVECSDEMLIRERFTKSTRQSSKKYMFTTAKRMFTLAKQALKADLQRDNWLILHNRVLRTVELHLFLPFPIYTIRSAT